MSPPRSALCVPASEPAKVRKALASGADEVVVDLEDAVLPRDKVRARQMLTESLRDAGPGTSVAVRINAIGSKWCLDDILACAASPKVGSLVIPKVKGARDMAFIERALSSAEASLSAGERLGVQALIENAEGLRALDQICAETGRLTTLVIGYADLSVSLGRDLRRAPDTVWDPAREAVLWAARAAGLCALDGPDLGVDGGESFRARVTATRDRGFDGTWLIHPRQLVVVHQVYAVEAADRDQCARLVDAYDRAGAGAVLDDGRMIDEAVVLAARRTLDRASRETALR